MTTMANTRRYGNNVNLNDILFDVEKVKQDDFDCNSDYAYDIFVYPDGKKLRVNSCSNRYELVPNAEIFPPIRNILIGAGIRFTEYYYHIDHARFYAEYVIEDHAFSIGKGDVVKAMLKVQHSYNGLTKYALNFGYFRLVCSNGLVVPVHEKSEFNINITGKHTKAIRASLQELTDVVNLFVSQGDKPINNFQIMADKWVENWADRVVEVMTVAGLAVKENSKFNTVNHISGIIRKEADLLTGGRVNDWLIYNGINQYINDDTLNIKAPEVRTDMDRKVVMALLNS